MPFDLIFGIGTTYYVSLPCCAIFFNPLNAELNPTCHLLALLGVHHFLHVSRIRVNHPVFTGKNRKVDKELKTAEMKMWYSVYLVIATSKRNQFDTKLNLPPQWAPTLTSHKQSLVAAILSNVVAK